MPARFWSLGLFAAVAVLSALSGGVARAAQEIKFPAVFESAAQMKQIGIVLRGRSKDSDTVEPFNNRCYGFGGHDYADISVNDGFLAKYKARGFSLNSLCLALQSPLHFDPATGQPLPTYMLAEFKPPKDGKIGIGERSPVYPPAVPDCFKRGLPLHDCKYRFDINTGERLNGERLGAIARGRAEFDKLMGELKRSHAYSKDCGCAELQQEFSRELKASEQCRAEKVLACGNLNKSYIGSLRPEGSELDGTFDESGIALVDISLSLPLGYGYQLQLDNGAGPQGGDPDIARDPQNRYTDGASADFEIAMFQPAPEPPRARRGRRH